MHNPFLTWIQSIGLSKPKLGAKLGLSHQTIYNVAAGVVKEPRKVADAMNAAGYAGDKFFDAYRQWHLSQNLREASNV